MTSAQQFSPTGTFAVSNTLPASCLPDPKGGSQGTPVILHVGRDLSLLTSRSLILARTGVPVVRCQETSGFDSLLEKHGEGLLVLCHSVSEADCLEVLRKTRQRRPDMKILCMEKGILGSRPGAEGGGPISFTSGPYRLVEKVAELLHVPEWVSA